MIGKAVAAIAPVLAMAATQVHHKTNVRLPILPILLVVLLVVAGVVWARRRSRSGKNGPDRPDEWPPRHPERGPKEQDGPPPWR